MSLAQLRRKDRRVAHVNSLIIQRGGKYLRKDEDSHLGTVNESASGMDGKGVWYRPWMVKNQPF